MSASAQQQRSFGRRKAAGGGLGGANGGSHRRISRYQHISSDNVYKYVLRVGYLTYLLTPKTSPKSISSNLPNGEPKSLSTQSKNVQPLKSTFQSTIATLSDILKDSTGKDKAGTRFPKEFIKVFQTKLQDIAMGKDPLFKDEQTRATIGVYFGVYMEPNFIKQIKENRRVEDLVLMFVTSAQGELKKRASGDEWKDQLNIQVGIFVKIIRDALRTPSIIQQVPQELLAKLDMYFSKLGGNDTTPFDRPQHYSQHSQQYYETLPQVSVSDMPLVTITSKVFNKPLTQVQKDIDELRSIISEKQAIEDIKTCINRINLQMPPFPRLQDFESEQAYNHWKSSELKTLSQMMLLMIQANPDLAKSPTIKSEGNNSSPNLSYRQSLDIQAEINLDISEDMSMKEFALIPSDPYAFFKHLLELCLIYDLEVLANNSENENYTSKVMSKSTQDLLNECAVRWRLMPAYRVVAFLDVIKAKFDDEQVDAEVIRDALASVTKVTKEWDYSTWIIDDRNYLAKLLIGLNESVLRLLYDMFKHLFRIKPEIVDPIISLLEDIHNHELFREQNVDMEQYYQSLVQGIQIISVERYKDKSSEVFRKEAINVCGPLSELNDWIKSEAKRLAKRYPNLLLGVIDVVSIVLGQVVPLLIQDVEVQFGALSKGILTDAVQDVPAEDIHKIFKQVNELKKMHKAFCPDQTLSDHIEELFRPHVRRWLERMATTTQEWVNSSVVNDTFKIESSEWGCSASVLDLFKSFNQVIDIIKTMKWPDKYQNARFMTNLSQTVCKGLDQYCTLIEQLFLQEMFPAEKDDNQGTTKNPTKQPYWLIKAKMTIAGDQKVEPFVFTPETCVKLNNIEAARQLLDELFTTMDADKVAEIVKTLAPAVPEKVSRTRYLFTIKIVLAENLPAMDTNGYSDPYLVLTNEFGERVYKTRTLYETLNPRWEETFDIPTEKPMWLSATVWDRDLVGDHDLCGRAMLHLDPQAFEDYLVHDIWLDLDRQGRLLFRISVEGEKDEIGFYFGRAFRSLKRAENDITRVIVDRMTTYIRQCVNRKVLSSLLKPKTIDINKAVDSMTSVFAKTGLVQGSSNLPKTSSKLSSALTDVDIEAAIGPLFDYLDSSLKVLSESLSEAVAEMVISKLWKEILNIIDGILMPALSDQPTDMRPLNEKETEVVYKWLRFLKDYLHSGGDGLADDILKNAKYRELLRARMFFDWETEDLKTESMRLANLMARQSSRRVTRTKSLMNKKNLGSIRKRRKEKLDEEEQPNNEVILRILRMRPGTSGFLHAQLGRTTAQESQRRKKRTSTMFAVPPVPDLTPLRRDALESSAQLKKKEYLSQTPGNDSIFTNRLPPRRISPAKAFPSGASPNNVSPSKGFHSRPSPNRVSPTNAFPSGASPNMDSSSEAFPMRPSPNKVSPTKAFPSGSSPNMDSPSEVFPSGVSPNMVSTSTYFPFRPSPNKVSPTTSFSPNAVFLPNAASPRGSYSTGLSPVPTSSNGPSPRVSPSVAYPSGMSSTATFPTESPPVGSFTNSPIPSEPYSYRASPNGPRAFPGTTFSSRSSPYMSVSPGASFSERPFPNPPFPSGSFPSGDFPIEISSSVAPLNISKPTNVNQEDRHDAILDDYEYEYVPNQDHPVSHPTHPTHPNQYPYYDVNRYEYR